MACLVSRNKPRTAVHAEAVMFGARLTGRRKTKQRASNRGHTGRAVRVGCHTAVVSGPSAAGTRSARTFATLGAIYHPGGIIRAGRRTTSAAALIHFDPRRDVRWRTD